MTRWLPATTSMLAVAAVLSLRLAAQSASLTPVVLPDESARAAFRAWFVLLADAQFYRTTADVNDCAALVRHAAREALRPHTEQWLRQARLPLAEIPPDVGARLTIHDGGLALFRVPGPRGMRGAEFADARHIIQFNASSRGRDAGALQPGDLLYFRQDTAAAGNSPDHLMIFVGRSAFESDGRDWVVYHTGPDRIAGGSVAPGEVRKVRLSDLVRHPSPRWRPVPSNQAFAGVYRLRWLDAAHPPSP